ncbi:MAG TPA: alpha/beta hydrolase fold domain-containing protein [Terriglobales bacterium]|nr:alpha/beta hydrolase fold domain-containing protein [Terriglobales bacterium]
MGRKQSGFISLVLLWIVLAAVPSWSQGDSRPEASKPPSETVRPESQIKIDPDGTYHLPAQAIPMSSLMSKELKESLLEDNLLRRDPKYTEHQPDGSTLIHKRHRELQDQMYPTNKEDTKIGGVHVIVYTPKDGVSPKNKDKVLIELHSADCWADCAPLGSQPIAYLGKIKVVAVDYREVIFPLAVEDVANVYSAILKSYKVQNVGLYGCSRGGALAARSLAWFQKHNLPRPAAVGVLCASAGGDRGDAGYIANELGNGAIPQMQRKGPQVERDLGDIDPADPMVNPVNFPEILSKFPPTLMITGTRSIDFSTGVHTHAELVRLGVEADLHVFEGGRHSFWYDPAPPESKQVYDIIVKFFDRHLGARK